MFKSKITTMAGYVLIGILALMPFHAFLTVFASTFVDHYDLLRVWKECLLIALTPFAVWFAWKDPAIRKRLSDGWLFWGFAAYATLHIALGAIALAKGQVNSYALLYAWIVNLRPMAMLTVAYIFALQLPWLQKYWRQVLLIPATIVVGFGMLQATVLPHNFLHYFGYNVMTIQPYQTVDDNIGYVRIQSTLRGANPLGAYLIIVLAGVFTLLQKRKTVHNMGYILLGVSGLAVLAATYSRSAYLGTAIMGLAILLLTVRSRRMQWRLWWGLAILALVLTGAFVALRNNDQFENTFFHTSENSQSSISSNEQRFNYLADGLYDVVHEPFGRGPGTAGPASVHNAQPARIAENYYLQIGQEVGWLGLVLFVLILASLIKRLWHRRDDLLARVLLASLIGISVVNLIQHAWVDDTLAFVWWGLAGIALAMPVTHSEPEASPAGRWTAILQRSKHEQKTKTGHKS